MQILHGRNLIIKADGVAIAAAKSCVVNINAKTTEVASSSEGEWEHVIPGRRSWEVKTSHLVTDIRNGLDMVGTQVTLGIGALVTGTDIYPEFSGFVSGVTTQPQPPIGLGPIYYDTENKCFVMKIQTGTIIKYYTSWRNITQKYSAPEDGDLFVLRVTTDTNAIYCMKSGHLTIMTMQGQAIVTGWSGTFSVENLGKGSFSFKGNGPLV